MTLSETLNDHQQRLSERLNEFRQARDANSLTSNVVHPLAHQTAAALFDECRQNLAPSRAAVTLLCEIAALPDQNLATAGVQALFPELIERLNDSFALAAGEQYDRIFAHVIEFHRQLPAGQALDNALKQFGLTDETALLTRKARLRTPRRPAPAEFSQVKKVLLPSRVTLGADIAVTSPLIAKMRDALPEAEFVWLGSAKLRELFGGEDRVRVREIRYERGGTVLSRLLSWLDVRALVNDELTGFAPEECWVIDADSRLTQLGLLPLVAEDRNYFFFESRSFRAPEATHLGQLAVRWLDELLGEDGEFFPFVALPAPEQDFGHTVAAKLRRKRPSSYLIALSLGVGGNAQKRVSDKFESELLQHFSQEAILILDKGASHAEREQINRLVAELRQTGKTIIELNQENADQWLQQDSLQADVLTWEGGIGAFASLIAASDEYVGYDSAGQHIAAALGVPTLTVFVNANTPTFAERWRPYGSGRREVVLVPAETAAAEQDAILAKTLVRHRRLRER